MLLAVPNFSCIVAIAIILMNTHMSLFVPAVLVFQVFHQSLFFFNNFSLGPGWPSTMKHAVPHHRHNATCIMENEMVYNEQYTIQNTMTMSMSL